MRHPRSPDRDRHHALALQIARGLSVTDAARSVGYCRQHASRLLGKPAFRLLVAKLHGEFTIQAAGELIDARSVAIGTLREMAEAATNESVRVTAATKILELMLKVQDVAEIRVMLEGIQKRLRETSGGGSVGSHVDQDF